MVTSRGVEKGASISTMVEFGSSVIFDVIGTRQTRWVAQLYVSPLVEALPLANPTSSSGERSSEKTGSKP